jgi:hypothetical protein
VLPLLLLLLLHPPLAVLSQGLTVLTTVLTLMYPLRPLQLLQPLPLLQRARFQQQQGVSLPRCVKATVLQHALTSAFHVVRRNSWWGDRMHGEKNDWLCHCVSLIPKHAQMYLRMHS